MFTESCKEPHVSSLSDGAELCFLCSGIFHIQKMLHATSQPPRPRVASDDHTRINTSARLTAGTARLRDVFSRSQIVPLHFITVWSLLCRRLLPGCNWEQMRRPVRASVVMSARVEGKARRDRGRKWSWSDGGVERSARTSLRFSAGLQVSRAAQQPQHSRKNSHADL